MSRPAAFVPVFADTEEAAKTAASESKVQYFGIERSKKHYWIVASVKAAAIMHLSAHCGDKVKFSSKATRASDPTKRLKSKVSKMTPEQRAELLALLQDGDGATPQNEQDAA